MAGGSVLPGGHTILPGGEPVQVVGETILAVGHAVHYVGGVVHYAGGMILVVGSTVHYGGHAIHYDGSTFQHVQSVFRPGSLARHGGEARGLQAASVGEVPGQSAWLAACVCVAGSGMNAALNQKFRGGGELGKAVPVARHANVENRDADYASALDIGRSSCLPRATRLPEDWWHQALKKKCQSADLTNRAK